MTHRVAIIEFINESNTFTVMRTGMEDFHASHWFTGDEIPANFRGTGSEVGGAIEVAEARDWQAVYITAAHAEPGGPVTEAARAEITNECTRRLREEGPFDGVFVALHGAMVTETDEDGDCQFLRAVRAVVGDDIPLAVTLDLHANIADELAGQAQIAVSFRTYPHVDMREVGVEACELLHHALEGEITPKLLIRRPPMLVGCDDGRTTEDGPMCRLLEDAAGEMQVPGLLNVAINAGFTDADVSAAGPSVLVTYDTAQVEREAAGAVAARYLARPEAASLLILGAGRVAAQLPDAFRSVRPINRLRIWDLFPDAAVRLAASLRAEGWDAEAVTDLQSAVPQADIISAATLVTEPLLLGDWLAPGQHVDLIGAFTPAMREADDRALQRARLFVDTPFAAIEAGELKTPLETGAIARADILGDLEALAQGKIGRGAAQDITLFKSVGNAVMDLAAAMTATR